MTSILAIAARAPARPDRLRGVRQVLVFNWPSYARAAGGVTAAVAAAALAPMPAAARAALLAGAALAAFWSVASLAVSHWVYDRHGLARGAWAAQLLTELAGTPRTWVNIHSGFDESTETLRRVLRREPAAVLDLYNPTEMTEPSIRRARRMCPPAYAARVADPAALPLADGSCDAILLLFAAHELRRPVLREALFAEVRRALRPGGRVVVAEHLRDAAGFVAFGPGFLHFYSPSEWRRVARAAGLSIERELRLTPWARGFVFRRLP